MAYFKILREVTLFDPGKWQLCFQFGTYEYDPDQGADVPSEDGYRFIWRRPNGQLQGARGQARLMPEWITILLGKAAAAGWYPVPPLVDRTPSTGLATGDLTEGARALRWAAAAQHTAMRRAFDAADPVPGVREVLELGAKLAQAAQMSGQDRSAFLRKIITPDDLSLLSFWAKNALGPSFANDPEESQMRRTFAALMRRLETSLRTVLELPTGAAV